MNTQELMIAMMARRALGEAPVVALANAFHDLTGESYAEYQQLCRMRLEMAGQVARKLHSARAAAQRAAA